MPDHADQGGKPLSGGQAWRVAGLLLLAVAAGLLGDWLRSDQRLVFARPLPEFRSTPPP
jgi:hypothetical protein